eukprot:4175531-Pleurochrysis_carterae.AAC.2
MRSPGVVGHSTHAHHRGPHRVAHARAHVTHAALAAEPCAAVLRAKCGESRRRRPTPSSSADLYKLERRDATAAVLDDEETHLNLAYTCRELLFQAWQQELLQRQGRQEVRQA